MQILSHRGYWFEPAQKNTPEAFERSFDLAFGTETDVRDLDGQLVISHDPPRLGSLSLQAFLAIYGQCNLPLAVNIKADGLATALKAAFEAAGVTNFFVFDMSVPDMRLYRDLGIPYFTRLSEVEPTPAFLNDAAGIWLDAFSGTWFDANDLDRWLGTGKLVCVVSPELHRRDHVATWALLRSFVNHKQLMLCTDLPEQARDYFMETT
jgi:hypothetical protein